MNPTTSQICPSERESRHDGIPVILIPFLAIQNSSAGLNFWVASSWLGGGSMPLAHSSRATAAAPWQATQCVS
jgi:hypothetical protein